MKYIVVILLMVFPLFGTAQNPDTCFTVEEVYSISETLDSLFELTEINEKIIREQDSLISYQEYNIFLKEKEIDLLNKQNELLRDNIDIYIKREELFTPKWYERPYITFPAGILTAILAGKLAVSIIN